MTRWLIQQPKVRIKLHATQAATINGTVDEIRGKLDLLTS